MPCSKGMKACKPSCVHRCFVIDYQVAREAQVVQEETITYGDPEMVAERRFNGIRPIIFKEWLSGHKREPPD